MGINIYICFDYLVMFTFSLKSIQMSLTDFDLLIKILNNNKSNVTIFSTSINPFNSSTFLWYSVRVSCDGRLKQNKEV